MSELHIYPSLFSRIRDLLMDFDNFEMLSLYLKDRTVKMASLHSPWMLSYIFGFHPG